MPLRDRRVGMVRPGIAAFGVGAWLAAAGFAGLASPPAEARTFDVVVSPPTESSPEAKKLLDKVQARYAKVQGLRARFHQELTSATLGQTDIAEGECWFAKPGKMRWAYDKPTTQVMVSDGKTLWFYEPDKEQVTKTEIDPAMLEQVPTGFLNGTGTLTEGYIAVLPALDLPPKEGIAVDLTPQRPAPFEKLRVVIEPTTHLVTEITIYDPFGNVNRLTFTEIEPGAAKETAFFQFTTPEGVREIAPPMPPTGMPP